MNPQLFEQGRLNPGYLKLDLYCRGLRVAPDCDLAGARGVVRVRAGLGSGLELVIPPDLYTNVPVVEDFARASLYSLHGAPGRYTLCRDGTPVCAVRLPPEPRFYARLTARGTRMSHVGVLQGTYLGVYFGPMCANWKDLDRDNCRFCSVGENLVDGDDTPRKRLEEVVEVAAAARDECGATFVHVNGGFDDSGRYLEKVGPLLRAVKERTGMLTGYQFPPLADLDEYRTLRAWDVDNVSLCFELFDPRRFAEVCPGKARRAGLAAYLAAIERCLEQRFHTVNGEMIAGLEPPASTMAGIDWLTERRAVPTVCVFRPVPGTQLAGERPPRTEDMVPVFAHLYRRCMERKLFIGVAPNVKVSLIMLPEECRWLLPPAERDRFRRHRFTLALAGRVFGAHLRRKMRRHAACA